jgi:hypothetical protein
MLIDMWGGGRTMPVAAGTATARQVLLHDPPSSVPEHCEAGLVDAFR